MKPASINKMAIYGLLVLLFACADSRHGINKIRGVSFVGPVEEIDGKNIDPLNDMAVEWVCFMPFAYGEPGVPGLSHGLEWQWWGEKQEGVTKCIELFRNHDKKIMIKPQLWIRHGDFTGDFKLNDSQSWTSWENDYEKFILAYARVAEIHNVEMFCIGTELKTSIKERPEFWYSLINKVKKVYSGKLTYAANWDNYQNIPFWKELDFIGIDAYFPLTDKKNPGEEELILAWEKYKEAMLALSAKMKKPILFTEAGYRSIEHTTQMPWDSRRNEQLSYEEQEKAYSAMFRTFWFEDRFAGIFIWKWFEYHNNLNGERYEKGYTPQKKPAQSMIKKWYLMGKTTN